MATTKGHLALSFVTAALAAGSLCASTPQESLRVNVAASHLMAQRTQLGLDADHAFALRLSHSDALGQTHGHFQQTYKGVRVWGGDVITHTDRNGHALAPTNALQTNIRLNVTPSLQVDEALAAVHQDLAPRGAYAYAPTSELVIYPVATEVVRPGRHAIGGLNAEDVTHEVIRYTLAYHIHTELENAQDGIRHMDYMVDANTGALLTKWNTLHTSAAVGTGNSQYSGVVSLDTNSTASGFELRDMTRGTGGNYVTDGAHVADTSTASGAIYTNSTNTWGDGTQYVSGGSDTNANGQTAAVDAMFGMAKTWDFYKNVLGRNGIDGSGTSTYSRVHISNSYDNAFWSDSCFCMTYGDGSSFTTLTAIDVAGHEMSHGVCANSVPGGLTYSGESGGLNEANSDIFGTMTEFYAHGAAAGATTVPATGGNWTIGEQLATTPLRYMYKPSLDGTSPDAWYSGVGSVDVHYSSGPMNRCFYFMSQGASATSTSDYYSSYTPSGFAGVGNDHAARIHYRALTTYYTSNETYAQARAAEISAAKDLYGAGSPEEQAVWNAFAAINVGSKWSGGSTTNTVTASISAPASNVTVASGSVVSFAGSATDSSTSATLTYGWTFGDGATATTASASHTYTNTGSAAVTYTATFKATDNTGAVGTATRTITVNPVSTPPPAGTFSEVEPNDTIATANVVAPSFTAIRGNLTVSTDKDFFALTLNPGQKIAIAMTGPTGVDWDLKLVNAAGTQLAISQGSTANENLSYTNAGTTAMTVYANVYVYSGVSATGYNLALTYSGGTTPPPVDTQAPTASVTESGNSGTITFSATATDNVGVTKVEFYVDGVLKGTDTTSPYTMTLDSTTLTNGTHSLVAKAYDAAGNVGTSSASSFSVSNTTPPPSSELVTNGGFESGATGWSGTTGDIGTFTGEPAHAGTKDAWLLGNGSTATESLSQAIAIPSTITKATLTFWMHIDTAETTTTSAYDTMKVQVISGATTTTLATYSNLNANTGFAQMTFDLSAFKGQTVTLKFLGSEDSSLQTSFVLDDVSIKVQ